MSKSKDWGGNKKTQFVSLGASNHASHERAERDLYTTNQKDFIRFLKALKRDGMKLAQPVYEPATGLGHLVEVLQKIGCDVIASDIEDRSGWESFKKDVGEVYVKDFLQVQKGEFEFKTILTNPPFAVAENFVRHGMSLLNDGEYLMLLLRIQWLESQGRYKLFQEFPFKYVYVYVSRANCYFNGEEKEQAGACCFAWFCYEKGWSGDPVIKFIQ